MDDIRARYLRDRVLTATPAQRVVMLFDRLLLDLTRAAEASDGPSAGPDLGHAVSVVAELLGSLDLTAGGPAENLGQLYDYLLMSLTEVRATGDRSSLPGSTAIVHGLRDAFAGAAAAVASSSALAASVSIAGAASQASQIGRVAAHGGGGGAAQGGVASAARWVG